MLTALATARTFTSPAPAETNPSISPAATSMMAAPPTIRTAVRPLNTSASPRARSPGATTDRPSRNPAAPATQIANSSRRPWPRMNSSR